MKKLAICEANELIEKAHIEVAEGREWKYRFGQSIWNNLPEKVTPLRIELTGTDKDFFYWTNNDKVIESLFENFVDLDWENQ
ncbi:hypothetical protein N9937_00245 [bacterium]|nr:hypothetical protein [bacterium]